MLNVVVSEDLVDHAFVDKWCHGYEQLAERVRQFTPEWAEPITWIPAEKIREATRMYASGPAGIEIGRPVEGVPEGNEAIMNIHRLIAITGNLDVPGGSVICRPAYGVTTYPYSTEEVIQLYGAESAREAERETHRGGQVPAGEELPGLGARRRPHRADGDRGALRDPRSLVPGQQLAGQPGSGREAPLRGRAEARFQRGRGPVHDPDRPPGRRYRPSGRESAREGLALLHRGAAQHHPQDHRRPRMQVRLGDQLHPGQTLQSSGGAVGERPRDAHRPHEALWLHLRADDRQGLGSCSRGPPLRQSPLPPLRERDRCGRTSSRASARPQARWSSTAPDSRSGAWTRCPTSASWSRRAKRRPPRCSRTTPW